MIEKGYSVYSQYGEDGIIQYLIDVLQLSNKQCCEIGMSGIVFSNTYNLVENYNWYGVYVEKNKEELDTVKLGIHINLEVEKTGINSIDNILKNTKLDKNFDILSIDIDGIDYYIWDGLSTYEPNVVIIEINPFLGYDVDYINRGSIFSSSFKSVVELGNRKGYTLVCMTGNLIFVKTNLLTNTELEHFIKNQPHNLFLNDAIMIDKKQISFRRYIKREKLI